MYSNIFCGNFIITLISGVKTQVYVKIFVINIFKIINNFSDFIFDSTIFEIYTSGSTIYIILNLLKILNFNSCTGKGNYI